MAALQDKDSQKKQIGELLKNADRFIKNADWPKALEEVNKSLAIEPNNMYALAYKDRINASIAEEKKKQEEEKVKKLTEDKKAGEKAAEVQKQELAKEDVKAEEKKSEEKKPEEKKAEPPKESHKQEVKSTKEEPAKGKDDSGARIEALRQEFGATQAKLQREVAQLTMQVKEAQALKDATEKNLNAQLGNLQQELAAAKQLAGKGSDKEVEALKKELEYLKSKHLKELDNAREIAKAEGIAQLAIIQKELEASKTSSSALRAQGELVLRSMFQKAWQDGVITEEERALLKVLKGAIEMTEAKFGELESATKNDAYINALRSVWSDGHVTPDESDFLQTLRDKLGIPADEHFKLESQIRKELKK
jgi:hypothetical protein